MKEVNELIKKIQSKTVQPVYVFDGEEPYFIDVLCDAFEEFLLEPHEKDFNFTTFYSRDSHWSDIVNTCRSYPAFAQRRLVIVKEAAQLKDFDKLKDYFLHPLESTVLVIAHKYKKLDGRQNFVKELKAKHCLLTFDKIKEYDLGNWILSYCTSKKIRISQNNAELVAMHLGNDLQKITNELEKVLLNLNDGEEISAEHIERYIGISKEYNVFAYTAAIRDRQIEAGFRIVHYFIQNPKDAPLVVVAANLYNEFNRLYQYHYLKHQSDTDIAAALKMNKFFIKDYKRASMHYTLPKTIEAIQLIHQFNLNSIGMHTAHNDIGLLKEITAKLFAL
jgi:DNA polymerase-3 subunit delta